MNKTVLIIVVVAVVMLGAGGAAGFFLFGSKADPAAEAATAPGAVDTPEIVKMETFLVNLTSAKGDRFAKVDLQLTVTPPAAAAALSEDSLLAAKLRDRVLTLLTSKQAEDLLSPMGKEGFRRELKASLNPLLPEGEIQEVLFANFVVQ